MSGQPPALSSRISPRSRPVAMIEVRSRGLFGSAGADDPADVERAYPSMRPRTPCKPSPWGRALWPYPRRAEQHKRRTGYVPTTRASRPPTRLLPDLPPGAFAGRSAATSAIDEGRRITESWIAVLDWRLQATGAAYPAKQAIDADRRQGLMRRDAGRASPSRVSRRRCAGRS